MGLRKWSFLAFAAVFTLTGQVRAGTEQLAHAIFVRVNSKTITQDNVVEAVKYLLNREFKGAMPEDEEELENLQNAALRDLIRMHLIHDEASRLGIKMDRGLRKQILARSGLKPEEITPTIRKILEADDLFDDIMMAEGTPISNPSPRQMKDFYNKNREEFRTNAFLIVRTIFIADDGSRPQSFFKGRAEALQAELEAVPVSARTEAFGKKAEEVSQDIFARYGGLLTGDSPERWIPKDFNNQNEDGSPIFPPPMVEAIGRLSRKGDIRLAVSADGMHLMYCEDIQGGKTLPWEEASRIIEYVLKQRTKNTRMRSWLSRVYDRSDVRWHDGTRFEKNMLTAILLPSERGPQN